MCGISAFIANKNKSQKLSVIQSMNNLIEHRGPDDEGYFGISTDDHSNSELSLLNDTNLSFKLILAHRRLAILDISDLGHQPLSIDEGDYWIIFNGEVYNYLELKQELANLGIGFNSETDTEVVLTAYKVWGKECLNKLNGMFAFIIYDRSRDMLFMGRDRFGIKPLYYYQDDNGIYFASEIKQFRAIPRWKSRLNHHRANDFLEHSLIDHTSETLFANVYQLRGGEYLELKLEQNCLTKTQIIPIRWYDLPDNDMAMSYEEACTKFKESFTNSIKLHLRTESDIGSCLSGGLDSSSIVTAANLELQKEKAKHKIQTFSACSDYKEFDEKEYIDIVVDTVKADAYFTYPSLDGLFSQHEKITWHQDEPFISTSIYAQWEVFRLAQSHNIKVMLDGQGADEQLCGYTGLYIPAYLKELFGAGKWCTLYKELNLFQTNHGINKKEVLLRLLLSALYPLKQKIKKFLRFCPRRLQQMLLGKNITANNWPEYINRDILQSQIDDVNVKKIMSAKNVKEASYNQLMYSNLPMLLHFEDRDSMAHSIESRVPFLDYNLVELIYNLPTKYKIGQGTTKKVLRDGLKDILPDAIKNRHTKLGFVTPEEIWVRNNPELFKTKLKEAISYSKGIFNSEKIINQFEKMLTNKSGFDFTFWRIISFGSWMKVFNVEL